MMLVHVGGITGGGYESLIGALSGHFEIQALLVLCAAKLVATVFSYASGGAGGIFAPSLVLGATLGGAFGVLDVELLGHAHAEVGAFALVGMGAVFAGTIRAPITSVLIIIEMTGGYGLTLPLMITNMTSYALARHLRPTPIYEALLAQDGIDLHAEARATDATDATDDPTADATDATDDLTANATDATDATDDPTADATNATHATDEPTAAATTPPSRP